MSVRAARARRALGLTRYAPHPSPRAAQVLSLMGVKLEYYITHTHEPSTSTVTWTLDYDRTSDLDDSVGYVEKALLLLRLLLLPRLLFLLPINK